LVDESSHANLHALHRRIDISGSATGTGFLPQHIPWLYSLPQLHIDAVVANAAIHRETKLHERIKPCRLKSVSTAFQVFDNSGEILCDKIWKQEKIVKPR